MRFVLRAGFWLALVYVLLPGEKPSDLCLRHKEACAAGSRAWKSVEQGAQSGVKTIQDLLAEEPLKRPR